ncbi:hypothetical protein Y958_10090 [Nitrospirillum viridazoti CBAmc]|uniref:Uncharacterized protein n=1 Tax=Nitrospirillum viridazoti CBAmc TaxID=1441467 RepID=A0A248JR09_9PROT|nr:hypothetical protein Y958_10090 [Nitrospirillum amazonense CBAmc]
MMTERDPTTLILEDWIADLDAADAEIEVGLSVPGEEVRAKLEAALDRMRSGQQPTVSPRSALTR